MKTKVLISDVLHLAADKYLAVDNIGNVRWKYSCIAVDRACDELKVNEESVKHFIFTLGCDTMSSTLFLDQERRNKWGSWNATKKSQGNRYLWLKFAAVIAEDEGI